MQSLLTISIIESIFETQAAVSSSLSAGGNSCALFKYYRTLVHSCASLALTLTHKLHKFCTDSAKIYTYSPIGQMALELSSHWAMLGFVRSVCGHVGCIFEAILPDCSRFVIKMVLCAIITCKGTLLSAAIFWTGQSYAQSACRTSNPERICLTQDQSIVGGLDVSLSASTAHPV